MTEFMKDIYFFISKMDNFLLGPLASHFIALLKLLNRFIHIELAPKGGFFKQTSVQVNFHEVKPTRNKLSCLSLPTSIPFQSFTTFAK